MADVFGKLNEFLNKKDDDSFSYDMSANQEEDDDYDSDSIVQVAKTSSDNNLGILDIGQSFENFRAGRKRKVSKDPDESFDLTQNINVPIGKSRRKLADDIEAYDGGLVDLCDFDTQPIQPPQQPIEPQPIEQEQEKEAETSTSDARPKKKGKTKKTQAKKGKSKESQSPGQTASYKKALQILNRPITLSPLTSSSTAISSAALAAPASSSQISGASTSLSSVLGRRTSGRLNGSSSQNSGAVDLTGEVEMGPNHNHGPLFRNEGATTTDKNVSIDWDEENDDDIDMIRINVRIQDKVRKFPHNSSHRFYELFKKIADSENVPISNVYCFLQDKRVYPESTPQSIGHKISSIYDATVLKESNKKDTIEIKFQSDKWKRPISIRAPRVDKILSFVTMLCKQIKFTPEQISLSFDGDSIDMESSPMDNDFEGGEILDCRIKAK